jgi:hypothetical protein
MRTARSDARPGTADAPEAGARTRCFERSYARKQPGTSTGRLVACYGSWLTKRSAGRKLNPITKRHKSRSHECIQAGALKEAEDERMRAAGLVRELNECRAERDRLERERKRVWMQF